MLTRQEIFTKAYLHAKNMKNLATDSVNHCFYRAPNGEKCLIGALIPDEEYRQSMEMINVTALIQPKSRFRLTMERIGLINEDSSVFTVDGQATFLRHLQSCHDSSEIKTVDDMMIALRKLAREYNLSVPE